MEHSFTPLLKLPCPYPVTLLGKAEWHSFSGSIKGRAAQFIIDDALQKGLLAPGGQIIEATSGNMGIALAAIAAQRGCQATIVMPDSMSVQRQQLLRSYGAEILLTPGALGMTGAQQQAQALAAAAPGSFYARQFDNPAGARAHYCTTGPEIWQQTQGTVEMVVAGVGTGGTITGLGKYLKEQGPVEVVAVEPKESAVLSGGSAGSHRIQGIGAGFLPGVLDRSVIDRVIAVPSQEAIEQTATLQQAGFPVGISGGGAYWAALQLAAQPENRGKTLVVILPDGADRYGPL